MLIFFRFIKENIYTNKIYEFKKTKLILKNFEISLKHRRKIVIRS